MTLATGAHLGQCEILSPLRKAGRRTAAFTLIELMVVVSIIALLLSILLPSLGAARETAHGTKCLSNLRQVFFTCSMYANEHAGVGPALGFPWGAMPHWAVVARTYSTRNARQLGPTYVANTILICPTVDRVYAERMTRTYAVNVTGHAGQPGDPNSYDDRQPLAQVRFDRVRRPANTPAFFDSARAPISGNAPPPPRTASVLDFRQPAHVSLRLGRFHQKRRAFNVVSFDGSARTHRRIPPSWKTPLP